MAVPSAQAHSFIRGKGSLSREIGDKVSFPEEARRAKFARHSRFAPSSSFFGLEPWFPTSSGAVRSERGRVLANPVGIGQHAGVRAMAVG